MLSETFRTIRGVILRSEGLQLALEGSFDCECDGTIMLTRFTISPVGSGKTALTLALCQKLRSEYNLGEALADFNHTYVDEHELAFVATVTNDIFTREDQEFLIKNKALPSERILAIETGGCPHAAIREDISANMGALETLQAKYGCQLLFVESGGDNLAANYSRELADYIIYVIDVSVRMVRITVCGSS